MKKLVDYIRWKLGWTPEARCRRILEKVPLGREDIALDCGANVGDMTAILARSGAEVHAFEPNPHAFKVLSERFGELSNVHCHNAAVGTKVGRISLYLHQNSEQNEVLWSNGSSLLADKPNVSPERSVEVEVVDLAEFLRSLPKPAKLLKIDIEGAEVEVLNHLIGEGCLERAEIIFVETHDAKIPSLAGPTAALRRRLQETKHPRIHLDWV